MEHSAEQHMLRAVALIGLCFVLIGIIVAGCQTIFWMRYGHWIPIPVRLISIPLTGQQIPYLQLEWVGIGKVIEWVLECSLEGTFGVPGFFLARLGTSGPRAPSLSKILFWVGK